MPKYRVNIPVNFSVEVYSGAETADELRTVAKDRLVVDLKQAFIPAYKFGRDLDYWHWDQIDEDGKVIKRPIKPIIWGMIKDFPKLIGMLIGLLIAVFWPFLAVGLWFRHHTPNPDHIVYYTLPPTLWSVGFMVWACWGKDEKQVRVENILKENHGQEEPKATSDEL